MRQGDYTLLRLQDDIAVVKYSSCSEAPRVYAILFGNLDSASSLDEISYDPVLIDEIVLEEDLMNEVGSIKKDYVKLENGAEGYFVRLGDDRLSQTPARGENGKYPMITLIHGGPFSASPQDMFLIQRNFLILQGWCLLIVNYRGTIGFGKEFMDSLLGHIGSRDVEDCGNLTKAAIEQFSDIVDPKRVCVEGGSHGGFLTGWLIGHPEFKDLWAAAGLWNAVLDMTYMVAATDIPDWIYACSQNKELESFGEYTVDDSRDFFLKSPISQVKNVRTPSLFLVGNGDKRVPPHQSYFYYNCLKSMGVDCKLYDYPDSGHALMQSPEHFNDAYLNITLWMDKYAMEPYRPKQAEEAGKQEAKPEGEQEPEANQQKEESKQDAAAK